ncbi:hypothetical protein OG896_18835 [Streptomyces sp. NBC_00669]|uniref:hypothetical protein n=1 Tax=Streptomyces sp. NBC_00669 TaxID=2976011 RepID=UPI002E329DBA|nr:hypothetical protein [Streptomyces sp. NBC_00669]
MHERDRDHAHGAGGSALPAGQNLPLPTAGRLVPAFSLPVPSRVICEVLGVPCADHLFFQESSQNLVQADSPEQALQAVGELSIYFDEMISDYLVKPGPGMIERLPGLRLAVDVDRLRPRDGGTVQGVNEVPVTWGGRS